jgi:Protein of unknown function (DUF3347)
MKIFLFSSDYKTLIIGSLSETLKNLFSPLEEVVRSIPLLLHKFLFMRFVYTVIVCSIVMMTSCNTSNGGKAGQADSAPAKPAAAPQSKLNDTGTRLLMAAVTKYYALKNAMVAAKAADANSAAAQLATITDSLQTFLQKNNPMATVKPFADTIFTESKAITTINDESCEKQRLAFGTLSGAMYGLLKNVDLKNAKIYHEFCPMAFNDKGATWLSDESEIKNPYFGKKMMECGEVTDSL